MLEIMIEFFFLGSLTVVHDYSSDAFQGGGINAFRERG